METEVAVEVAVDALAASEIEDFSVKGSAGVVEEADFGEHLDLQVLADALGERAVHAREEERLDALCGEKGKRGNSRGRPWRWRSRGRWSSGSSAGRGCRTS